MREKAGGTFKFNEALTYNGSEFCGGTKTLETYPFERLLKHFGIKHRRTKPYRPQKNGKIERFWCNFHEDVIEEAVFETLDDLKDAVIGYNFYHNEHRLATQGIEAKFRCPCCLKTCNFNKRKKKAKCLTQTNAMSISFPSPKL